MYIVNSIFPLYMDQVKKLLMDSTNLYNVDFLMGEVGYCYLLSCQYEIVHMTVELTMNTER